MTVHLDHLVIVVRDLDRAADDFRQIGLEVHPGGQHANGLTHNALVPFADGTYLELLAGIAGVITEDPFIRKLEQGEGLVSYALGVDCLPELDPHAAAAWGVLDDGRTRLDGVELRWRLLWPNPDDGRPFFIEDVTSRSARVPTISSGTHGLGALGIARVRVVVRDTSRAAAVLAPFLGQDARPSGASRVEFVLPGWVNGSTVVELVEAGADADAKRHLDRVGEGPYAFDLVGQPDTRLGALPRARVRGVAITFVAATGE